MALNNAEIHGILYVSKLCWSNVRWKLRLSAGGAGLRTGHHYQQYQTRNQIATQMLP
jgi:hypothetical protein